LAGFLRAQSGGGCTFGLLHGRVFCLSSREERGGGGEGRVRGGAGGGGGYTPNTTSRIFWFDANDSACVYSGTTSAVTGLRDKSGVGNNATNVTGTAVAKITSNAINGLPALYLDNTGFTGTMTIYTGNVWSFYFLTNVISTAAAYGRLLAVGNNTVINDFQFVGSFLLALQAANVNQVAIYRNSMIGSSSSITLNVPCIFSGYFDGTNVYFFLNGTLITQGSSTGAFSNNRFGIGCNSSASPPETCDKIYIGEILLYQTAHTTSDRQKLEGYLAWKWGLQGNLPAGHPYKSAAPV